MVITSRLTNEELLKGVYNATKEFSKLIDNQYLIIGKNPKTDYYWFECHFEKKHFMHLLGIKSKTLTADEFYDKCNDYNNGRGDGIKISDCTPSRNHNRTTINEKVSCCADMLRFCIDKISSFPITLIPNDIDEYASVKYKVLFVFEKSSIDEKYTSPLVEIKTGILSQHLELFPEELKSLIAC